MVVRLFRSHSFITIKVFIDQLLVITSRQILLIELLYTKNSQPDGQNLPHIKSIYLVKPIVFYSEENLAITVPVNLKLASFSSYDNDVKVNVDWKIIYTLPMNFVTL